MTVKGIDMQANLDNNTKLREVTINLGEGQDKVTIKYSNKKNNRYTHIYLNKIVNRHDADVSLNSIAHL